MRFPAFLFTLLFTMSLNAQKDLVIDLKLAPMNPVPLYYTANHDGMTGKVKKVTETYSNDSRKVSYWSYDEKGFIKSRVDSSDLIREEYIPRFLPKVVGILRKSFFYSNKTKQETDRMGVRNSAGVIDNVQVTLVQHSGSRSVYQEYYTYGKKGELLKKSDGKEETIYTYNKKGQLLTQELLIDGKSEYKSEYIYKAEGTGLVISIVTTSGNSVSAQKDTYNASGQPVESLYVRDGFEQRSIYTFDAVGNWITKRTTEKKLDTGKIVSDFTITRKIEYY